MEWEVRDTSNGLVEIDLHWDEIRNWTVDRSRDVFGFSAMLLSDENSNEGQGRDGRALDVGGNPLYSWRYRAFMLPQLLSWVTLGKSGAGIIQMSWLPPRLETKAIWVPSGDQAGSES